MAAEEELPASFSAEGRESFAEESRPQAETEAERASQALLGAATSRYYAWMCDVLLELVKNAEARADLVECGCRCAYHCPDLHSARSSATCDAHSAPQTDLVECGCSIVFLAMFLRGNAEDAASGLQALIDVSSSRDLCRRIARGDMMSKLCSAFLQAAGGVKAQLLLILRNLVVADAEARSVAIRNEMLCKELLRIVGNKGRGGRRGSLDAGPGGADTGREAALSLGEASSRCIVCLLEQGDAVVALARTWWIPFLVSLLQVASDPLLRATAARKLAQVTATDLHRCHSPRVCAATAALRRLTI